ncbi:MAG: tRNA (cytidine(34)-2'-O)-methyltransferase [Firmicutes bacterium ADurb.Bin182]|nr:MAG: tRNA (cytidine(34)-2'-O)-methyltransferase [Firmicutes bacterium ADurb.Bin182]
MFNIVLVEPEIPQNTGNISRTCAVTGSALHLVGRLGFSIEDKHLKRAGLDYWKDLKLFIYKDFEEFESKNPNARMFLASTHASHCYTQMNYRDGDFLIFGKETAGLPKALLEKYRDSAIRIPMCRTQRSLNLSNAAAIVLYEALRQCGFLGLD